MHGFNVLDNSKAKMKPPYNPIRENSFVINTNNNIFNKNKNKLVLTNDEAVRIYNSGPGNCFFK